MLEGHKQRKKQNKFDKVVKPPQAKWVAKPTATQATACKSAAPHLQVTAKPKAKSQAKGPPTKEMLDRAGASWSSGSWSAEAQGGADVRLRKAIDTRAEIDAKDEIESELSEEEEGEETPSTFSEGEDRQPRSRQGLRLLPT